MRTLPYSWKALITVSLGAAMTTLDASIITIAFPELIRVFQTDLRTIMWVTVVYILVSSSLMLLFGKLSDFVGRKRIYSIGFGIFTLAMAGCSAAQSVEQIILCRIVQGIGAAMAIGCSTAIVAEAFPGNKMGKGLGLLGVAVSAGFIIGPVAGGFLLEHLGWRAIFYARIPFSVLAFMLAVLLLKKDSAQEGGMELDLWGALISFCALFCLLFGMAQVKTHGLKSPVVLVLSGAGLVLLWLLPWIEHRARNPIIDFGLFKNRDFSFAMAAFFVFFITMPVYIMLLPFYLMDAMNLSASDAGMLMSVIPVTTMFASPASGAISDRFGPRWPSVLGAGVLAASFLLMSRFSLHSEIWMIVLVLSLLGLGSGIFQPPNNSTIMRAVDPQQHGSASAMISTNRQVAMSLGMTLSGIVYTSRQAIYYEHYRLKGCDAVLAAKQAITLALGELMLPSFLLALIVLALCLKPPYRIER